MVLRLLLILILLRNNTVKSWWTDHFAAKISGEENVAKEISKMFGIRYLGKVLPDLNYYHFKILPSQPGQRWIFPTNVFLDKRVTDVLPQTAYLRVIKNENPYADLDVSKEFNSQYYKVFSAAPMNLNFNDPFFPHQWYLDEQWMNVFPAWSQGFNGFGITSVILDDGLYYRNPDIGPNYDAEVSYDVSDGQIFNDPTPDMKEYEYNSHGTQCAAIISAAGNNNYCGVGIAYKANIGGVRLLTGKKSHVNDVQESLALQVASTKKTDIVVSSWGPPDDGKSIGGPEKLAKHALIEGIHKGRNGKGAIFLWAVGNGGLKDNCNLDGYASSIYTIAISSLTKSGYPCVYDEPCSAALASCFVGGRGARNEDHLQTENMVVPQLDGGCTNSFQGTSAAAPLAAGIVALMLQANRNLTWRDVQHIIVRSARKASDGQDWSINGAGLSYHHFFGFGAIDASKAVELSIKWHNVPIQSNVTFIIPGLPRCISPQSITLLTVHIPPMKNSEAFVLEHTILKLTLKDLPRGEIELFLISPSGTESQLLTKRSMDFSLHGFKNWSFMSTHFWLENPTGIWTIIIKNLSENSGEIENARILFFGFLTDNTM